MPFKQKGIEPLEIWGNRMKLVLTEDLGLSSSSFLLQRRKLDLSFEPEFFPHSRSHFRSDKKEPQRNEKQNKNEEQKESPDDKCQGSFFLWKISDSNRSPQHCQRCALAR